MHARPEPSGPTIHSMRDAFHDRLTDITQAKMTTLLKPSRHSSHDIDSSQDSPWWNFVPKVSSPLLCCCILPEDDRSNIDNQQSMLIDISAAQITSEAFQKSDRRRMFVNAQQHNDPAENNSSSFIATPNKGELGGPKSIDTPLHRRLYLTLIANRLNALHHQTFFPGDIRGADRNDDEVRSWWKSSGSQRLSSSLYRWA